LNAAAIAAVYHPNALPTGIFFDRFAGEGTQNVRMEKKIGQLLYIRPFADILFKMHKSSNAAVS